MAATDHLIGLIYEAALAPARWPATLAKLADAMGGVGAHVVLLDKTPGAPGGVRPRLKVSGTRHMDPGMADRYMREWHMLDPLLPAAGPAVGPPGTVLLCHDFLSADFVAHDMYFQDFLIPSGGRYQAGLVLENNQDCQAVLDIHSQEAPFEREQLLPWAPVIAHLRRAVRLTAAFAAHLEREALLRRAIDNQGVACVMVNNEARVLDHSQAGAEMLACGDGLRLDAVGRVGLDGETRTGRLRVLIANACAGRGGGEMPLRLHGPQSAMIRVVPAGTTCDNPFNPMWAGCALLFVELPRPRRVPNAAGIRSALGCSQAEAEVAAALIRGRASRDIAAERATSIHTVRAQVRALLAATGTHRVAELVSKITMT
jgi:DNA-binding CsgD family transcriptional regulator